MKKERTIGTSIQVPESLRKRILRICRKDNRTMSYFLIEAIRLGLPVMRRIENYKRTLMGRPIRIGDFRQTTTKTSRRKR